MESMKSVCGESMSSTGGYINNNSACANLVEGEVIEVYIFGVVIPDILLSSCNLILTFILYRTVEIGHPQFAIIFQSHCFGNVLNFSALSSTFLTSYLEFPVSSQFFTFSTTIPSNFIWYLGFVWQSCDFTLFQSKTIQIISPKLKKCAFAFVWIFFIIMKVCNNITFQFCTLIVTRIVFHSLTILPVVLSIFVYVVLKIILAKHEKLELLQHKYRVEENSPQNEHEVDLAQVWFCMLDLVLSKIKSFLSFSEWIRQNQIKIQVP